MMDMLRISLSSSLSSAVLWIVLASMLAQEACATVTIAGSVYCDQCLEGHRTLWGLPMKGAKVLVECKSRSGQVAFSKEATTDVLGAYSMKVELESANSTAMEGECVVKALSSSLKSSCNIGGTTMRPLSLSWKLFGFSMYTAEGLSFKPAKPMSFCPTTSTAKGRGGANGGKVSLPPLPFTKLSACSHEVWLYPQYRCYWRLWSPKTKVSTWYGPSVQKKFGGGEDMTLEEGLRGSGEVRRVLLRESIAASLNAFNSLAFYYNPIQVDFLFNKALAGSDKDALKWALNFKRANSGFNGKAKCLLTPCK